MPFHSFLTQIWAIAVNVWREAVRDRILHILAVSGVILFVFSVVLGQMAVGGRQRVSQDMGFWILGIWGLLSVIYLGSNLVRRELAQKTIYMILSRPVSRSTFLLGKFSGVLLILTSLYLLLSTTFLLILVAQKLELNAWHFIAILFILGEWILLSAISLFFASFTSPLLHNFFVVGIAFLGHWCNDLKLFALNADSILIKNVLKFIYFLLPNLEAINFRQLAVNNYSLSGSQDLLFYAVIVLMFWTGSFLAGAIIVFGCRKLL